MPRPPAMKRPGMFFRSTGTPPTKNRRRTREKPTRVAGFLRSAPSGGRDEAVPILLIVGIPETIIALAECARSCGPGCPWLYRTIAKILTCRFSV